MLLGRPDAGDDRGPLDGRELFELSAQPRRALGSQGAVGRRRRWRRDRCALGRTCRRRVGDDPAAARAAGGRTSAMRLGAAGVAGGDGARRRGSGGSPRAPSASPSGTWTIVVGGGAGVTGSAMSEPVKPVAFRSPVGRLRLAKGRTTVVSGSASRSAVGTRRRTPPAAHPRTPRERPWRPTRPEHHRATGACEPVTTGIRPPVAELGRGHRRDPPGDGALARADVEDGLRRKPERGEPGGERLRESAAHRRDEASPRARSTCRRGSARSARSAAGREAR